MLKPLTVAVVALGLTVPEVQLPGDRPAANPRATRSVVLARNGIVATSQPLASAAGLRVLQQGGNAIDAAVTAAAVLSVVEPTMNGVGGDLFAIVYDAKTKTVRGLNASGRAAAAATPDEFRRRKLDEIPYRGVLSVSVPGVVDGWQELLSRHGTITLARAARAGDRLRARRLRRQRDHRRTVAGRGKDPVAGSGGGGDVPSRRPGAARRRSLQEPESCLDARRDCARRARCLLSRTDRAGDRGRHEVTWRPADGGRPGCASCRLGRAHLDDLSRLRGAGAAAEHAGHRRARDAQHPRGLRREGAWAQLGGLSAPARGSQTDRLCGSGGVARRCRPAGGPCPHQVQGIRGRTPARDRSREGGGELRRADARRPAAGRAGTPSRQG